MPGNSFGQMFRISTWGESHGGGVGVVIDGCPAGVKIDLAAIQKDLTRRRPGQSHITTGRQEMDQVEILSGVFEGISTGTPIALLVRNKDANPSDYEVLKKAYRPGHADFTYDQKYGRRNWQGGGRSSARETIGRVAAGAIAKEILRKTVGVEVLSCVEQVGSIKAKVDADDFEMTAVEQNIVRCPDQDVAAEMIKKIEEVKRAGDTIGGVVLAVAKGVPTGLGEPVFDKLSADLAKAMISLPATKAFEIGSGKDCLAMLGSEHNDVFVAGKNGETITTTNNAGGILGGISNGQPIVLRVTFKPVSTIFKPQMTMDKDGNEVELEMKGRHDPCVVPRAVPIVEAMMALVLVDHLLRQRSAQL